MPPRVGSLADLWTEHDQLRSWLAEAEPPDRSATLANLEELADDAERRWAEATEQRTIAEERAAQANWLRRAERQRADLELRRALGHANTAAANMADLRVDLSTARSHQEQRSAWFAETACEHERLTDLVRSIDHATEHAGRAAEVARPAHITNEIGAPPVSLIDREAWRAAAGAIESYRARWGPDALASEPATIAQSQHLDRVARLCECTDGNEMEPVTDVAQPTLEFG